MSVLYLCFVYRLLEFCLQNINDLLIAYDRPVHKNSGMTEKITPLSSADLGLLLLYEDEGKRSDGRNSGSDNSKNFSFHIRAPFDSV